MTITELFTPVGEVQTLHGPRVRAPYVCKECGEEFSAVWELGGHTSRAHPKPRKGVVVPSVPPGPPTTAVECDECGKVIQRQNYLRHLREVHKLSIPLMRTGRPRKDAAVPTAQKQTVFWPVAESKPKPKVDLMPLEGLVATVLDSLFPKGIPVSHLSAVVAWREATEKFLHEIS